MSIYTNGGNGVRYCYTVGSPGGLRQGLCNYVFYTVLIIDFERETIQNKIFPDVTITMCGSSKVISLTYCLYTFSKLLSIQV